MMFAAVVKTTWYALNFFFFVRPVTNYFHKFRPLPVLPEELIIEILLRLPVRSLLQFRSVCKSWKTIISDPQFAHNQFRIDPNIQFLSILPSGSTKLVSYSLKSLFENQSTTSPPIQPAVSFSGMIKNYSYILGSCNGLLCVCDKYECCFTLCNPTIGFKSKISPTPGFDWNTIWYYGFGYDQLNDKYKVVLVRETTVTIIYTFGEDSWKTIQDFPCAPIKSRGIFVSGTLNWIVDENVILSFDLEKETYQEVLLPQNHGHNADFRLRLFPYVLNNCLCVCYATCKTYSTMWLMKEYGVVESWTKLLVIPHDNFNSKINDPPYFIEPLFILENVVLLILWTVPPQLVLYNLNSGQLDYPFISTNIQFIPRVYCESQSLLSPRC